MVYQWLVVIYRWADHISDRVPGFTDPTNFRRIFHVIRGAPKCYVGALVNKKPMATSSIYLLYLAKTILNLGKCSPTERDFENVFPTSFSELWP